MKLHDEVYRTLVDICNAYPWPVVQDDYHIGEILNAVAWAHRDKGYGLSSKTGGKHIDSPVGLIAEDILQLPDGNHFDVLGGIDVGQPLRPGHASSIGIINLRDRPWVKPKDHRISWLGGVVTPEPPPVVTPPDPVRPPVATEPCKFQIQDCKCQFTDNEVKALAGRIEILATHFDGILQRFEQTLSRIEAKPSGGGNCVFRR